MANITTKTTKLDKKVAEIRKEKAVIKVLTLDEIEQRMIELATDDTTDIVVAMANEKKMGMLEKIANFKLQRLRLKELEKSNVIEAEPIEVKFVSSDNDEQKKRLEQIDAEIGKGITTNNA